MALARSAARLHVLRNLGGVSGVEFNYDLSSVAQRLDLSENMGGLALLAGFATAMAAILLSLWPSWPSAADPGRYCCLWRPGCHRRPIP